MELKRPISTLRKIIREEANSYSAHADSEKNIDSQRLKLATNHLRVMRLFVPEMYQGMVRRKDSEEYIKRELGEYLYKLSTDIWIKILENEIDFIKNERENIKKKKIPKEKEEFIEFMKKVLNDKICEFKVQPSIISAYSEKGNLLEEYIKYVYTDTLNSITEFVNYRNNENN